jgi:fatty acid desaturase
VLDWLLYALCSITTTPAAASPATTAAPATGTSPAAEAAATISAAEAAATNVESLARSLRPLLPPQAFRTDPSRLALVLINLAILGLGWTMARTLDQWPLAALPLFLPFSLLMGNAVIVLLFATHDLLHGRSLGGHGSRRWLALFSLALLWMPPTLWRAVHNREHHGRTNSQRDPDRSYLEDQPASWGKWIQHRFTPSDEIGFIGLTLGLAFAWGVHNLRTLASVLLAPDGRAPFPPAAFRVSAADRRRIAWELLAIVGLHAAVIAWVGLDPRNLLLGYFLPIWLGYAGAMAYIFTNHLLAPLDENNDPLLNTLSLELPRWLDLLHLNFSHHTEHHIFPGLNTSYYPEVRRLLQQFHGDRFQLLSGREAWRLLLSTPRHYRGPSTVCSADGRRAMELPRLSGGHR